MIKKIAFSLIFTTLGFFQLLSQENVHELIGTFKDKEINIDYLVQFPESYQEDSIKLWPMIFFLHGAGEKGPDIQKLKKWGPPKIAEEKGLPFIVVSPQCPEGGWWTNYTSQLELLLKHVLKQHRIDSSRIYLTGLSMGGYGSWALAMQCPDYFAAIAPICGGGDTIQLAKIKDIPTWVFHGSADNVIPPSASEEMVKALEHVGGNVTFTLYEGVDHFSWIPAYNDSGLFDWFLKFKKGKK